MKNVIITNLSTLPFKPAPHKFSSDMGEIQGINTNDAPVRYLLECLKGQDAPVKILAVTTKEAKPAYEKFCEMIGEFSENLEKPEEIETSDTKIAETIKEIISHIQKDDKVYIDTTGGFRNSSYLLMAVVRILEYSDIHFQKAVYAKYVRENESENTIEDVTSTYQMFNLINAAEMFTSLGNSDGLQKFFDGKKSMEIKNVIKAMNKFSEEIALCRTSGLDEIMEQLNTSLNALDSMNPTTENEILFQSISGVIRKKFGIQEGSHKKIDYVDMIRWCLDNKQIQQAVTIYTEKIPTYFRQQKFYTIDFSKDEEEEKQFCKKKKNNPLFDDDYILLNEMILHITPETSSQYPIGRYMQSKKTDKTFRKALESASVSEFAEIMGITPESIEKNIKIALKRFFQIKKKLFDEKGVQNSTASVKSNFEKEPVLLELVLNSDWKTPQKLIKTVLDTKDSEKWYKYLQGYTPEEEKKSIIQNPTLNLIEHLSEIIETQKVYQIQISIPKMQMIFRDYLYIKNWLRHAINHASEENKRSNAEEEYFKNKLYPVKQNLSLIEVKRILERALKNLEIC